MLHKFFEDGDWFAPKRFGYGAGLPIAWQGWVLTLAFGGAAAGIALWLVTGNESPAEIAIGVSALLGLSILFVAITARRTRGGWRWRWGGEE